MFRRPIESLLSRETTQGTDPHRPLLIEGSMYDLLKRAAGELFDLHLGHMGLLYSQEGRTALRATYVSYIEAAQRWRLPILLFTPTWRCNPDRISKSDLPSRTLHRDAADFLASLRVEMETSESPIYIGGLMGCRNDCYNALEALSADESESFHAVQIEELASSGVDLLFASTLPAVTEAIGIARAMAKTPLPYALSFVLDPTGAMMDGNRLATALSEIDGSAPRPPIGYFVNCVHPAALVSLTSREGSLSPRLIGFQGNTSRHDPRKFDTLIELDTEPPLDFARAVMSLRGVSSIMAVGGCCGTTPAHISAIGELLSRAPTK